MRVLRLFLASIVLSVGALVAVIGSTAGSAHADTTIPALPYTITIDVIPGQQPLLSVCLTVKELNFGPDCLVVPNVTNQTITVPEVDVDFAILPSGSNILNACITIRELNFGPDCIVI